jgi:membrane protease YdiL (CAAX protease family)
MAASKKAKKKRKESPAASTPPTEAVPIWRPVFLIQGVLYFLAAAILWLLADPMPGDFARIFTYVLIFAGVGTCIYGYHRMTTKDPKPSRLDGLHFGRFFLDTWKQMDEEARLERKARRERGEGWDYRPLVALVTGAVCLTLMEYFGGSRTYTELLQAWSGPAGEPNFYDELRRSEFSRLFEFVWWAGWRVFGYLILPVIVIKATRQRIRDQGLETKGFMEHAWIYVFAFHVVFICVVLVSYTHEFSTYYPFYKGATRSWFDFLCWEMLYAAQFFSLEFFFRGWWLKTLKPMMGSHAIFAMVVPYCMIHYGKPFAETMGAIVAGIVLGTLAMKTRSIWSGFLIHVSVAISMDVAALMQTEGMPTVWYPGG